MPICNANTLTFCSSTSSSVSSPSVGAFFLECGTEQSNEDLQNTHFWNTFLDTIWTLRWKKGVNPKQATKLSNNDSIEDHDQSHRRVKLLCLQQNRWYQRYIKRGWYTLVWDQSLYIRRLITVMFKDAKNEHIPHFILTMNSAWMRNVLNETIAHLQISLVSSISLNSSLLFRTAPMLSAFSAPNCN